jgi:predicted ATPase
MTRTSRSIWAMACWRTSATRAPMRTTPSARCAPRSPSSGRSPGCRRPSTGLWVVGDLLGTGRAKQDAVVGETPNLAARLQKIAGPGEVVLSAQTRSLVGNAFELRDMGLRKLKGIPEPVPAFQAVVERAVETRFEARHGTGLTPMVGREGELAMLAERWRRAASGRGQVVLVMGEAGIGKSRIVRALEDRIETEPHLRVNNQCSPHYADTALYPMARQLVRNAGIQHSDSADARLDRLEALLPGADRSEAALIASLLGIEYEHRYGRIDLEPEEQRQRTFQALLHQLARASGRAPVLWLLEDAHWIDPTTLELVELCIDRIAELPVLVLITARSDFTHDFGQRRHVTRLTLGRLARDQVETMVRGLARGKQVPPAVLDEISAKTDGVPLFVEELTKVVLESGVLRETPAGYELDGALHELTVPASLHDSMMARLDRHKQQKEIAQTAACIGREFGHGLLAAVAGVDDGTLAEALKGLEAAGLIFVRAGQERQYVFKHALVRDAAYESLLHERRQDVHGRVLDALERTPETPPEILAQHATQAGLARKAIGYWQKAGALAIARSAYGEAIAHANQALRLCELLPAGRPTQETRLGLLLLLGQATIPLRGYSHSETVDVFARAQDLVAAMGDAPHSFSVSYARWVTFYVRGEHGKAFDIAHGMLARARREKHEARMLTALRALGISQMITGAPATAHATFTEAQQVARVLEQQSSEHRIAVAHRFAADPDIATHFHVGLTLWALGQVDQAGALIERTVEAARAMGHVHTLGHALAHGAIYAVVSGDTERALRLSAESIRFADQHNLDLWRGYGAILNGYALVLAGDTARAVDIMEGGFRHMARLQTGAMVPAHVAVHAYALAKLGRLEEAARYAAQVQDELRAGSERYFWPDCLRWTAEYQRLLPGASRASAEAAYDEALRQARAQGAKSWELVAATGLARLWAEQGERARARALLGPLYASFGEGFATRPLREASTLLRSLE